MKKIIIAQWNDGRVEAYSNLPLFLDKYPGRNYETIMHWISRKKTAFKDEEVTISRIEVLKNTLAEEK